MGESKYKDIRTAAHHDYLHSTIGELRMYVIKMSKMLEKCTRENRALHDKVHQYSQSDANCPICRIYVIEAIPPVNITSRPISPETHVELKME